MDPATNNVRIPSLIDGAKDVAELALPSMGSFILSYMQSVVIGISLGALNDDAILAAFGLGSLVSNLLGFSVGIGLLTALDSLVATAAGEGNLSLASLHLTRGRIVVILVFIPCTVAMLMSGSILESIGQDPLASRYAQDFVTANAIGLLPAFLFTADAAFLRGYQWNTPVLAVNVISAATQPFVCIVLVNWLRWDLWGAGLSVALSSWTRFIMLQVYMRRVTGHPEPAEAASIPKFLSLIREAIASPGLWQFISLALPSAALTWCEWWVYELQSIIAGWLGVAELAAFVVCCNIEVLLFMIPLGIQQAAAVLVGNSLGTDNPILAIQYAQLSVAMGAMVAICVSLFILQFRDNLARIYTQDPLVLSILTSALVLVAGYHFLSALNCILEGVLRGLRLQGKAVPVKVLSMIIYQLPVAYFFSKTLGINGIWLACISALILTLWAYTRILASKCNEVLN